MANRFKKDFFLHPFDWRYDVNLEGELRLRQVPYTPMWSFTPQELEYAKFYKEWCINPANPSLKKPEKPVPRWLAEGRYAELYEGPGPTATAPPATESVATATEPDESFSLC